MKTNENMTDNEAKQIILKHLISQHGEQTAITLFSSNESKLFTYHGLAWALGKESLEFFCEYYLHDIYFGKRCKELALIHYQMWRECTDLIKNKTHERQSYILPRGTAKSTITLGVAIWAAFYGYKSYILICSAVADTASKFIANIKNAVADNERIKQSFGTLYNPKECICNQEAIEFTNHTMIQSISAASSMRGKQYNGKRIELAILDDYQKAEEIESAEQREKKWKRFSDDISYSLQEDNGTIIALGTLQKIDDFYDRVRKSPSFITVQKKCIPMDGKELDHYFTSGLWGQFAKIYTDMSNPYRMDDCRAFYDSHVSDMQFPMLWQNGWDNVKIAMKYFDNPESFHQEMQGEIERVGLKKIKSLSSLPKANIENHNFIKTILSVDPAASTSNKSDYYAFCVLSEADNDIYYARKSIISKLDYDDYLNLIIQILLDFPDIKNISIEKNTYMGADYRCLLNLIKENQFLSSRPFNIKNEMRTRNKDARINVIIPDVNKGRIVFNEEDTEAIEQIKEFAGCAYTAHDDMIDCLADAMEHMQTITDNVAKVFKLSDFYF